MNIQRFEDRVFPYIVFLILIVILLTTVHSYGILIDEMAEESEEASNKTRVLISQYVGSNIFSKINEVNISPQPRLSRYIEATWYGESDEECLGCRADRKMANGDRYDETAYTAAANWLPLNSLVLFTYGSESVVVRITDRMVANDHIDLSKQAFLALTGNLSIGEIVVEYIPQ